MNTSVIVLGPHRWGRSAMLARLSQDNTFDCVVDDVDKHPEDVPEETPRSFAVSAVQLENVPERLRAAGAMVVRLQARLPCGHIWTDGTCPQCDHK